MLNIQTMKTSVKIFHWLPRILCILAILFVSMFALDAFAPGLTFGQQMRDFAIHLIPSFCLIGFLVLAWKYELIGGIVFILVGLGFSPFVFLVNFHRTQSMWISLEIIAMITFPIVLVGILFLISRRMKKNQPSV